jgi:AraC-like DNA-binding protein
MRYREFHPIPSLSKYVECVWLLENANSRAPAPPERLLPDGCVELILNFGSQFKEHKEAGRCEFQPLRIVVGQMTQPVLVSAAGPVLLIGVRFLPGGSYPFFHLPPGELTNQIVSLSDIAATLDREYSERVVEAPQPGAKILIIQSLLIKRLNVRPDKGLSLQPAISQIVRSAGQTSIDSLSNDLGITGRQLERRFLNEVGLGPKLLCRIFRFQQVFRAVERSDSNWAAIAADCGYYDQAHLIRDFRQFAGQTPAVLFEQFAPFTEFFTRKQRTSHFYNTRR